MTITYPLEPLAAALHIQLHRAGNPNDDRLDDGLPALAERLGMSLRTANRRLHTGLSEAEADRAAVTVGMHPQWIWKDWFDLAPGEDTIVGGDGWYSDDPTLAELEQAAA